MKCRKLLNKSGYAQLLKCKMGAMEKGMFKLVKKTRKTRKEVLLAGDELEGVFLRRNGSYSALSEVISAVKGENVKVLQKLLKVAQNDESFNINGIAPEDGLTALIHACKGGNQEVIELLLGVPNIDVNVKVKVKSEEVCAIIYPIKDNNVPAVRALLAKGANVNLSLVCEQGSTTPVALCASCGGGDVFEVVYPKYQSLGVEYKDEFNNTLAHVAAKEGNYKLMRLLLEHDTSLEAKNDSNQTPVDIAKLRCDSKMLKLMGVEEEPVNRYTSLNQVMVDYRSKRSGCSIS